MPSHIIHGRGVIIPKERPDGEHVCRKLTMGVLSCHVCVSKFRILHVSVDRKSSKPTDSETNF